jgi:3-oxoadipate enol-lactonase
VTDSLSVASLAGRSLRYDVRGAPDAPVLVLSNSLGTDLRMWDPQINDLVGRWRVVRYDTRGHGRSSVPPGPYSLMQLGTDVIDLLDHLDIDRAHFCGLSLGGLTGLYLAVTSSDRILSLAVCNASAKIGTNATWNDRIALVRQVGMAGVAPSVMARWFTEEFRARCPDAVRSVERQFLDTPVPGYAGCCEALRDSDLRAVAPDIRCPVLIISGARDPAVPIEDVRWLASQIPNAEYAELPTAHLSNVENPAAFTHTLSSFLAS